MLWRNEERKKIYIQYIETSGITSTSTSSSDGGGGTHTLLSFFAEFSLVAFCDLSLVTSAKSKEQVIRLFVLHRKQIETHKCRNILKIIFTLIVCGARANARSSFSFYSIQ